MSRVIAIGLVGLALSASMLGLGYFAGSTGAPPAGARAGTERAAASLDRAEVEAIVHEYLLTNPDIFIEVQAALETRERERRAVAQRQAIATSGDEIFNAAYDGVIGNPDGDVTVVEFFDYNCGYCKRAMEDMDAIVAADPDVRFVLKEFPILGPDSRRAHVVSVAFHRLHPERYGDFHRQLLAAARANEATAIRMALANGADEEALRREMEDPAIEQTFERTYQLADTLAVTGTPSYVVGQELVFGAQGAEALREKIELARASGS